MNLRRTFNEIKEFPLAPEDSDGQQRVFLADLGWFCMLTYNRMRTLNGFRLKPDLDPHVIVSEKYKFLFLGVPKAGTRSWHYDLVWNPQAKLGAFVLRMGIEEIRAKHPEYDNYFKFSFVRNPWARVLSTYNDKIKNPNNLNRQNIVSKHPGLRRRMSFEDFVDWLCSEQGQDKWADGHWISQHRILETGEGELFCDFVGQIESVEQDFPKICDKLSMPSVELTRRNVRGKLKWALAGTRPSANYYREFYTDRTRDLIADRYRRDIELFRYEF